MVARSNRRRGLKGLTLITWVVTLPGLRLAVPHLAEPREAPVPDPWDLVLNKKKKRMNLVAMSDASHAMAQAVTQWESLFASTRASSLYDPTTMKWLLNG